MLGKERGVPGTVVTASSCANKVHNTKRISRRRQVIYKEVVILHRALQIEDDDSPLGVLVGFEMDDEAPLA